MANTPNIRFKGFADDWEQRKFGELYKISSGYAFKMNDYCNRGVPIINGESIQHGKIESNSFNYLPDKYLHDYKDFVLYEGDIVLGLNRPVTNGNLKIAEIPAIYNKSLLYQRAGKVNYICDIDKGFTYVLLSKEILKYTLKEAVGSDQPFISTSKLDKWEMQIPQKEDERIQIGAYFRNFDHLITLHQRKCDEVRQLKKFMLQKMFPKSGELIPEIRFAGFTDAWEQCKLSEVLISLQNNTLSRAELSTEKGVAKNVHYGDILVRFREVLDVSDEQLPMIQDDTIVAKYKTSFLQNGDVIIADTAEDETVGKCTEIAGLDDETVISGLHTIPYRPLFEFASGYLGYYMNSTAYHSQLLPLMQGIKVTSISKSAMQNTDIVYPKSVDEQKQIGDYFRNLDHLITLHRRKCDELKEVKRFMLQNMFPQKG